MVILGPVLVVPLFRLDNTTDNTADVHDRRERQQLRPLTYPNWLTILR